MLLKKWPTLTSRIVLDPLKTRLLIDLATARSTLVFQQSTRTRMTKTWKSLVLML
jgi:hypothetical protein